MMVVTKKKGKNMTSKDQLMDFMKVILVTHLILMSSCSSLILPSLILITTIISMAVLVTFLMIMICLEDLNKILFWWNGKPWPFMQNCHDKKGKCSVYIHRMQLIFLFASLPNPICFF